mmetsp:Transcript_13645/g.21798  ORF Transcript_13645/g.21798 Transcript_13645/m.21798 type:complete len:321 (+) Transcript_13645:117-1079(+)
MKSSTTLSATVQGQEKELKNEGCRLSVSDEVNEEVDEKVKPNLSVDPMAKRQDQSTRPQPRKRKRKVSNIELCPVKTLRTWGDLYSANYRWFQSGFKKLDLLLGGGINTGEVLEVVGSSSIGKTQLCLTVASYLAAVSQDSIIYVDTANTFSPTRVQTLYQAFTTKPLRQGLKQIKVYKAVNAFALNTVLEEIKSKLQNRNDPFFRRLRLLIIDSIGIIAPFTKKFRGLALMAETGRRIQALAQRFNLALLVINSTVRAEGPTALKPALGETWSHFADARISMYFNPLNKSERLMALVKSHNMKLGSCIKFSFNDVGQLS